MGCHKAGSIDRACYFTKLLKTRNFQQRGVYIKNRFPRHRVFPPIFNALSSSRIPLRRQRVHLYLFAGTNTSHLNAFCTNAFPLHAEGNHISNPLMVLRFFAPNPVPALFLSGDIISVPVEDLQSGEIALPTRMNFIDASIWIC